jgi:hypothetical protein
VFFVEARYHRDPSRAGAQVRYIAHREEGLTNGHRRELYGIGERFRTMRGDEPAIRKALREDARGLRNPVYFRFILTVDNSAAERFRKLDGYLCERVLRDAVEKTFRGAARGAQGVFAVHQHGGQGRTAHPHVHALLSPRFENRMAVHLSPVRIQRIRQRWEKEVLVGLQRQERRLERPRCALAPQPLPRRRERDEERPYALLPFRKALRRGPTRAFRADPPFSEPHARLSLGDPVAPLWPPRGPLAERPGTSRCPGSLSLGLKGGAYASAGCPVAPARMPRPRPPAAIAHVQSSDATPSAVLNHCKRALRVPAEHI